VVTDHLMGRLRIVVTPSNTEQPNPELERNMKIMKLSVAVMATSLFLAGSAFAQTTPAQKQKTQEGGSGATPCNLVADPSADPDCARYKQRTQNLTPSPAQAVPATNGQSK
jgi:hypothetical protein